MGEQKKGKLKGLVRSWEKAIGARPESDNLAASLTKQKAFIPTYEKTSLKPDMKLLVTMEYRRMWFEECSLWHRQEYPITDKTCTLRRKITKDSWKKTKQCREAPAPPLHKNKRFNNVPAKVDTGLGHLVTTLIPKCYKCNEFHSAAEKCEATKLCDIEEMKVAALNCELPIKS